MSNNEKLHKVELRTNTPNNPTHKPYTGRIFRIRDVSEIPVKYKPSDGGIRDRITRDQINSVIFIFDETHVRVKTTTLDQKFVWIPKYILLKEIQSQQNSCWDLYDTLSSNLEEIIKHCSGSLTNQEEFNNLKTAVNNIRMVVDANHPCYQEYDAQPNRKSYSKTPK